MHKRQYNRALRERKKKKKRAFNNSWDPCCWQERSYFIYSEDCDCLKCFFEKWSDRWWKRKTQTSNRHTACTTFTSDNKDNFTFYIFFSVIRLLHFENVMHREDAIWLKKQPSYRKDKSRKKIQKWLSTKVQLPWRNCLSESQTMCILLPQKIDFFCHTWSPLCKKGLQDLTGYKFK